jgi:hypothetical protein
MSDSQGGSGGNSRGTIRDTRLVQRALLERRPIPKAQRGRVINRLAQRGNSWGRIGNRPTIGAGHFCRAEPVGHSAE